jgi:hypothetical protein
MVERKREEKRFPPKCGMKKMLQFLIKAKRVVEWKASLLNDQGKVLLQINRERGCMENKIILKPTKKMRFFFLRDRGQKIKKILKLKRGNLSINKVGENIFLSKRDIGIQGCLTQHKRERKCSFPKETAGED